MRSLEYCSNVTKKHIRNILLVGSIPFWVNSQTAFAETSEITLFTHGDTHMAKLGKDGKVRGSAMDLFVCSMKQMNQPFQIRIAPLSRANQLMQQAENAVWFPSRHNTNNESRQQRIVGPAGAANLVYFLRKDSPITSKSSDFKKKARVTAYKGSAMESRLLNNGFIYVEGSADRKRLIYMVLTDLADAILAVDFRHALSEETYKIMQDNLRVEPYMDIPVAFQVSKPTHMNKPDFTTSFRTAFNSCAKS